MGSRSRSIERGAFGSKVFTELKVKIEETYDKLIPPDPKTGEPAKTVKVKVPVYHKLIVGVVRPNRGRSRSGRNAIRVRGQRGISFGEVLKHNIAVKKKEEAAKKPGMIGKLFQRKEA